MSQLTQMPFDEWIEQLAQVSARELGRTVNECRKQMKKQEGELREWYAEGFAPMQVFEENKPDYPDHQDGRLLVCIGNKAYFNLK